MGSRKSRLSSRKLQCFLFFAWRGFGGERRRRESLESNRYAYLLLHKNPPTHTTGESSPDQLEPGFLPHHEFPKRKEVSRQQAHPAWDPPGIRFNGTRSTQGSSGGGFSYVFHPSPQKRKALAFSVPGYWPSHNRLLSKLVPPLGYLSPAVQQVPSNWHARMRDPPFFLESTPHSTIAHTTRVPDAKKITGIVWCRRHQKRKPLRESTALRV